MFWFVFVEYICIGSINKIDFNVSNFNDLIIQDNDVIDNIYLFENFKTLMSNLQT